MSEEQDAKGSPASPKGASPAPQSSNSPGPTDAPVPAGGGTAPIRHSPELRSLVHFGALLAAFPLTYLAHPAVLADGRYWAAGILLVGAVFNLLVLPRMKTGKAIRREGEGIFTGTVLYPLGLALAFLLYPAYAAGAAWAALAAGDAAAVMVGQRLPRPRLPWNPKKSFAGSLAFVAAALAACQLLLAWCPCPLFLKSDGMPEWPYVWTLAVVAAVSGAILESLDGPFDDNLRVPLGAGLAVWLTALLLNLWTSGMSEARAFQPEWFLHAVAANAALAGMVWALKFADLPGALAGGLLGTLCYFLTLPPGYCLLLFFVAAGSLLSRVGQKKKEERGASEARGGRRGLANVVANLGVPALCALAYPATKGHPAALLAYAGALSAVLADTASSEIGALASGQPVLITTRQRVAHGTNGAVTRLGYAAAFVACAFLAALAWSAGFWRVVMQGHAWNSPGVSPLQGWLLSFALVVSGLAGTTADSFMGATIEGRVPGVGKGTVNFLCALAGAAVGGGAGLLFLESLSA